jgi:hypothetical protein
MAFLNVMSCSLIDGLFRETHSFHLQGKRVAQSEKSGNVIEGNMEWEAVSELVETCVLAKDLFVSRERLKECKMKEDEGGILTFFFLTHHPSSYTSAISSLCRAASFDQFIHSLSPASPTSCIIFPNLAEFLP